jgi:hypothetical protein
MWSRAADDPVQASLSAAEGVEAAGMRVAGGDRGPGGR